MAKRMVLSARVLKRFAPMLLVMTALGLAMAAFG